MKKTLEQRFMDKVDKSNPSGCWEWTGTLNKVTGYGIVRVNRKLTGAHRRAYELFVGDIGDLFVLHHCDNPKCVRPDHLFLGTNDDNMQDMVNKGRQAHGTRSAFAKLSEDDVIFIREALSKTGNAPGIYRVMGHAFDVSPKRISEIKLREAWRHVPKTDGEITVPPEFRMKGSDHHRAKLTEDDIRVIKEILICGKYGVVSSLARRYGVAKSTIRDIKTGRSWAHVTHVTADVEDCCAISA